MSVANQIDDWDGSRARGLVASRLGRNIVAIVVLTAIAVVWQLRWGTVPDTSWLITACERMLSGERLYSQILETNPPFSILLYLPPVAAARALGIAPEILVHAWTYLAAFAGLSFAGLIVRYAGFPEKASLFALAPVFYAMLVIFPGNAFSEREHIGMTLFLPLLVLHAWRARSPAAAGPGPVLAALVGLSASVLLLIKPYYAVMVLATALVAAARRRSLKPIFAVEHWIIGAVCVGYFVAVMLVYPEFLRDVYPQLQDVYAHIHEFPSLVAKYCLTWCFLLLMIWRLWPAGRFPELAAVALAASTAGMIPLIYQGKGWPYHAYPALFCAVAAILCLMIQPRSGQPPAGPFSFVVARSRSWLTAGILIAFLPYWPSQKPDPELVFAVRAATDRPTVTLIGSDIAAGHPLDRMVGGRFVTASVSDWLGAFSRYLSQVAALSGDAAEAARYDAIMAGYAESKREEFERLRPDIVILDKQDSYWTGPLMERFGFDAILARYHTIAEDEAVRVYLRNDYARPPPAD